MLVRRLLSRSGIVLFALCAVSAGAPAPARPAPTPRPERPLVAVCRLDSEIHPAAADFLKKSIARAEQEKASLLILEISTPGGLMTSMREITTAIVNSKVPVATYVYPSGARAASAGFFVLLAGDVAAMAPGTNTGAAHPVGGQGEDIPKTMGKKVEQDALAQIRTLCAAHGRDAAAAEKAVTDSVSYTESEAKEKKLIELVARDPSELCEKLDGTSVSRTVGGKTVLHVRNPRWEFFEMGPVERALGIVSDPNLAYIFFLIGLVGIYFELSHPGAVLPGVAGGISLLLALYAFSVLPVNVAAVGLVALGILFIVAEVKFPVHGMLALAGAASFVAGSVLLFSGNAVGYKVRLSLLLPGAIVAAGTLAALSMRAVAVRSRPVQTGAEGLIGETGRALTDLAPSGRILAHGEYWEASSKSAIPSGSAVRIVGKSGFTLQVEALELQKRRSLMIAPGILIAGVVALIVLMKWVNILKEYERAVTFWLGRLAPQPKGPGFTFIFWPFETMVRVSLRTIVHEVPQQDIITRDNVSVKVSAVVYFRVIDAPRAVVEVENYLYATSQLAQTVLRSVLGQAQLDELLAERDKLNLALQQTIDQHTEPWGIKVSMVEVKQVDLPPEMQRAMAIQATAEREKRAKIIHAEGEFQASQQLANAAKVIATEPMTLQLRYLQTLTEIASEKNSTIVFPLPIEFFKAFLGKG